MKNFYVEIMEKLLQTCKVISEKLSQNFNKNLENFKNNNFILERFWRNFEIILKTTGELQKLCKFNKNFIKIYLLISKQFLGNFGVIYEKFHKSTEIVKKDLSNFKKIIEKFRSSSAVNIG